MVGAEQNSIRKVNDSKSLQLMSPSDGATSARSGASVEDGEQPSSGTATAAHRRTSTHTLDGGSYSESTTAQTSNTPVAITGSRFGVSNNFITPGRRVPTDTAEGRAYGAQHYYDAQTGMYHAAAPPLPPPRDRDYYRKSEPTPLENALTRVKQLEDSRLEYNVQIRKHAKEWVDNKIAEFNDERKIWETQRAALEEEKSRSKEECKDLRAGLKELEESRSKFSIQARQHAKEWMESETAALDEERKLWDKQRAALEEERELWIKQRAALEEERKLWDKQRASLEEENAKLRMGIKQLDESRVEYSLKIRQHAKEWIDSETAALDDERKIWNMQRAQLEVEIARLKLENKGPHAPIAKGGGSSRAELTQAIVKLTMKISAVGNGFSDRWERKRAKVASDMSRVPESLVRLLGQPFFERLCYQASPDLMILEYAAQACMVHYITDVIRCFCFGLTDEENHKFHEMYKEGYQREPVLVSSQWMALAHMYGKRTIKDQEEAIAKRIASELLGCLEYIDSFVGGQGGNIQSELGRDVDGIVESTIQLITMLKESVSSVIYEVYSPREGVFEEFQIQDVLGKAQSGEVLCTVEMGLLELSPKNEDGKFIEKSRVLLKAKVIVEKPRNKPALPVRQ